MPPAEPLLVVDDVAVRFGGVAALSGVNLHVEAGRVTGLIGPNGAGKTTLFNVVSGLQPPDRGAVRFGGKDLAGQAPHQRARLGIARTFQRLELFGSLSAGENVQVGAEAIVAWWRWAHLRGALRPRRARAPQAGSPSAVADELLGQVGLAGAAGNQASAMPTGLARMVELARALAVRPKLLLLDEPGSGLDDAESEALGAVLTRVAADGVGVLLVEHDMELVIRVCDWVHVLDFGEVIASGTPEQIRNDRAVQAAYLGTATA